MNKLLYTMWLSLACTPGSETFAKLNAKFSSPEEIYNADKDEIARCISSKNRDYNSLIDKDTEKAERVLSFCTSKNVGIVTYYDSIYPNSLRSIKNPPVLLYYRGKLPDFNSEFFVSVVGMRRLTDYGRKNTFAVAADLAVAGAIIVSGMAIGIDGVAHAGALSVGKNTVAVIGSGIDVCYPPQHKRLAREIVKGGCVMTEYAPGSGPEKQNFPKRNRIISGLSSVTLVMEGNERSGALITARHAKEQGRAVYAFPGNVGNRSSEASNLLIKNGAKLFTSADDIIRDFELSCNGKLNPFVLTKSSHREMTDVLRELEVACVTPSDDVFKAPRSKKTVAPSPSEIVSESKKVDTEAAESGVASSFDKTTLALYKKIPTEGECTVDDLVDGEHSLRSVMQGLLKLEVARFVTMLPGDRVKRNL